MVNNAISKATRDSPLFQLPPVEDPSEAIVDLLIKANKWNLLSRQKDLPIDRLPELHNLAVELMETLKTTLPERVGTRFHFGSRLGQFKGWCLEKAHSLFHIIRDLLWYGFLEVTSAQGPEHCHIELVKKIGHLHNNKQILLCLMRFHARDIQVKYLQRLLDSEDLQSGTGSDQLEVQDEEIQSQLASDANTGNSDHDMMAMAMTETSHIITTVTKSEYDEAELGDRYECDPNHSIPCELGFRYPVLQSITCNEELYVRIKVVLSS